MDQHPRRGFQMRDVLVRHKGGEREVDQGEGVDNGQQQPAAIARCDDGHHRTDHQANQRSHV